MGRKPVAPVKNTEFDVQTFYKSLVETAKGDAPDGPVFKQKKSFAPSTIGYGHGKCPRYWHYAFSGAMFDENTDYKSKGRMANGTDSHTRIQEVIAKTGYNILVEQEVLHSDPPIRGFIDVELVDFNIPVEIKTTNDTNYRLFKTSGHPSSSHRVQELIYMKVRGATEGLILYENKDTNEMHIIPILMSKRNEDFINGVFDWMKLVKSNIDDGKLPKRVFAKTSYMCKNCPVTKECWSGLEGDINIKALEVPKV
jgi:CRISPR/Cas system-associated exonuclease Cas4 (RecB family)